MKLLILDRDGTLNSLCDGFVTTPEEWVPLPGALDAVARLNQAGWRVVVASNQPGIGRGLLDMVSFNAINAKMMKALSAAGGRIEAVFFCPHVPEDGCACRKPGAGLFEQVATRFGESLAGVPAAGDSVHDAQAAVAAGCEPHYLQGARCLVPGCAQAQTAQCPVSQDGDTHLVPPGLPLGTHIHRDLSAFADFVLAREQDQNEKQTNVA